ncbi:CHAT domain-containing protein [Pseudotenacibaculum haliotis]|uniref:CHAT domain-containing protein n=1 Tax=Pseudotenacibaculum haliotis TaxID=1862138 RepID=A0ABW5LM52_9FLAO
MRKTTIYLLVLVSSFSYAQTRNILNSIENLYKEGKYKEVTQQSFQIPPDPNTTDSLFYAELLALQSNAHYELSNYTRAIELANQSILYTPNNEGGQNLKGMMLFDRAFSEYSLGKYRTSYESVKEAESILTTLKAPNLDYLLSIYADIAGTAITYGYLEEAEYYILKGISVYKENKSKVVADKNQASKEVLFRYKLVELYSSKKQEKELVKQIQEFSKMKNLRRFNDVENLMYAVSLNIVGDFYLNNLEDLERESALLEGGKYIEKALTILDKEKYPKNEIQFKFNIAKQLRYSKEYQKALFVNKEIIERVEANDERLPFFHAQRGILYLEQGKFSEAKVELSRMITLIHRGEKLSSDFSNFQPSEELHHTGLLVEIPGIIQKHFPEHRDALQLSSQMYVIGLQQFKNCYRKEELNDKLKSYYHLAIDGILKNGSLKVGEMVNAIENIENRLAWKEFLQNRKHTKEILPDSIFNRELQLRKEIVQLRKKNDSLQIIALEKQIENHREYLQKNFPAISSSIFNEFKYENFQKQLNENTCALKYKRIGDRMYLFRITQDEIDVSPIEFDTTLQEEIKGYIRILKTRKEDLEKGNNLYKKILPFSLSEFEQIIILPDDILYHLPFEALVDEDSKYLLYNQSISYASYLVFANKKQQNQTVEEIQIYRPNYSNKITNRSSVKLNGAKEETEKISELYKTKLFEGSQSSKSFFLNKSPDAKILHLSMHASINGQHPELSYFIFSEDLGQKLYLEELYGMKLQADLAVLSACSTGEGAMDDIKGHISLQRAFTYAGVSATVSSLWEAPDDATQQIMVSFYKHLKEGNSKSKALQMAKIDYLETNQEPSLAVPYYWAAFTISGNTTPLDKNSYWNYIGISLILLIVFFFRRNLRKAFKNS